MTALFLSSAEEHQRDAEQGDRREHLRLGMKRKKGLVGGRHFSSWLFYGCLAQVFFFPPHILL